MEKSKKILISLFFVFMVCSLRQTVWAAYLDLNAPSAILVEENTGKVLYAKEETTRMYPASMTKILTALVAMDYFKPDDLITTGNEVNEVPPGSSLAGHTRGETLLFENLIRGLIIPSGNETSNVVAMAVAKKVKNTDSVVYSEAEKLFSDLMNKKAAGLGAVNTHFTNPHGYHDDEHYTTATDLALIARAAMEVPIIRQIAAEKSFSGNGAGEAHDPALKTKEYNWVSHNDLLNGKDYAYPYATGIKTGLTNEAGYCLAASAEKDGKKLIAIVFDATETGRWEDTKKLFEFGFNYYNYETVQEKGVALEKVLLQKQKLGESRTLEVLGADEFIEFLSIDEVNKIKHSIEYDEEFLADEQSEDGDILLKAPIEKDAVIGKIVYTLGEAPLFEGSVLAARDVEKRTIKSDITYYIGQVRKNAFTFSALPFWIGGVVIILVIAKIIQLRNRRRNRNFYRLNKRY